MSPTSKSKSKSKEKPLAKTAKEQLKASKLPGSTNMGNASSASAYNPVSGTLVSSSPPLNSNGRIRNIDEAAEHSGSSQVIDYDSLSNNGSCSGESEDHKEKIADTSPRQETIPGSENEKREKIRQKNEKKHQRQRERRAQELHDRCSGYLMSRKLEALSEQLVAMGFTSERATMALMLNEGKVEESINWLFEVSEKEALKMDRANGTNLKIDISEELAHIAALEARYKCSKQDVERAVIVCEGDLVKAKEKLEIQKLEHPVSPLKPVEKPELTHPVRLQEMPIATITTQLGRNEFEPGSRHHQLSLRASQSKSILEKRWPATEESSYLSYSAPPPMQVTPSSGTMMAQFRLLENEGRISQQGAIREPVIMMQRPQSMNVKQNPHTDMNVSLPGTTEWYPNNVSRLRNLKPDDNLMYNQRTGRFGTKNLSSQHFYPQTHNDNGLGAENFSSQQGYPQTYISSAVDPAAARPGSSWNTMGASPPPLTVPSSLGLFLGWGSTGISGSSSHVDWNARDMMSICDYNSIDWTLDSNSSSSNSNGLMLGLSSMHIGGTKGIHMAGLQERGMPTEAMSSAGPPREWTSPFAGKDIFSVPRQFVTSPSP